MPLVNQPVGGLSLLAFLVISYLVIADPPLLDGADQLILAPADIAVEERL